MRSVYLLVLPQTKFHLFPRFQNNRKKETSKQKVFKPETNTETKTKAFEEKRKTKSKGGKTTDVDSWSLTSSANQYIFSFTQSESLNGHIQNKSLFRK